jgi:hypothetical protein
MKFIGIKRKFNETHIKEIIMWFWNLSLPFLKNYNEINTKEIYDVILEISRTIS